MRIYEDCYQLVSEIRRDVYEMGALVKPKSMQNKNIEGNIDFETKEILNYSYCLQTLEKEHMLFIDKESYEWCKAEFNERVDPTGVNPGEAWKLRENVWKEYLNDSDKFDYSYGARLNERPWLPNPDSWDDVIGEGMLRHIIGELDRNPDTRQAILSIWDRQIDPGRIGGIKRVPCSMYYQVIIRDNLVHIIYNQRSCDVVTHFGNDVWQAWHLKEFITQQLRTMGHGEYRGGNLYHNIASLHSYRKDWDILKKCITETMGNFDKEPQTFHCGMDKQG